MKNGVDPRSFSGCGIQFQPASGQFGPFLHSDQSQARPLYRPAAGGPDVKPFTIIFDRKMQLILSLP
ncbi:MAG: hypothetical protein MPW15_16475 [Candidatus Manganitrophus sp.]|nr:hypothetical protein [Candidatus Manganitrophus sp.]